MPSQWKEKFQQLTEFEWGKIINFREGGFFNHVLAAHVQQNSSIVMGV